MGSVVELNRGHMTVPRSSRHPFAFTPLEDCLKRAAKSELRPSPCSLFYTDECGEMLRYFQILKIPAKKWGDTEIAERGRSVLVMRARYRSAGLTLHQRGWTDAG